MTVAAPGERTSDKTNGSDRRRQEKAPPRMLTAAMQAAGVSFPRRQRGFHLFRHTWATWMRPRYEHLDATEEAEKANLLPVPTKR